MVGTASADAIWNDMQTRGIEFVFAQFVDMYARPSAKLVPVGSREAFDGLLGDGAGFAGFAAGEIGQVPSDPDIAAIPDLASYTPVPWQPNLARFACDVTVEGEEWAYCPRTILRRVLAQAKERGFEFRMGLELEYFLVKQREDGTIEIADAYDTLEKPCYDMAGLTRRYDFLTTVSRFCNELGWGNYANDHEDANGQFEQNFTYDDALVSCDRAIFFRYMVHTLAEQHGMIATFMPKPFSHLTATAATSTCRSGTATRICSSTSRIRAGSGSRTRRTASSAGFADARTCVQRRDGADRQLVQAAEARHDRERRDVVARVDLVRLQQPHADAPHPGPGRIEDRTIDGSCNPYLAAAAVLAAGMDGIENGLDAGEPNSDNLYSFPHEELRARGLESLPANLLEAIGELEADDVLRAALGRGRDEDYVDYFARVKRDEWFRYHEQVTPWEIREYLTRF